MAATTPASDVRPEKALDRERAWNSEMKPVANNSQAGSSLESIGEKPDPGKHNQTFKPLPSLEGWRGLAHYRTESRRKVVKKKPEDRTASDLYVLEESLRGVKLVTDLPLAKRLEVCKYLGYEVWEENQHVYEQGAFGSTFYILFTGLVRASVCEEGVQEPKTKVVLSGDCFGELALTSDDMIMAETAFTTERCELLTLSRKDYYTILEIEKTPEMKERVKFLKNMEAFNDVSKQSLQRLASVLNSRTYSKNKVITFQGDEAFEMFFIKSGECRIIMEISSVRKPVLRLPRVSSFVYMNEPTIHHKCKLEVLQRKQDFGRPSLVLRPSQLIRSSATMQIPAGLPDTLLDSPELIHELALGHTRAQKTAKMQSPTKRAHRSWSSACSKSASKRHLSAPLSFRENNDMLSARGSPKVTNSAGLPRAHKKLVTKIPFVSTSPKVRAITKEDREVLQLQKSSSSSRQEAANMAMAKEKTIQPNIYQTKRRRSSFAQKYTLDTFLDEVEAREREVKALDFSEKDHALWHMGMSQGAMKTGFSEDVKYYKNKFQKWARGVLDRERNLFGFNVYDNQQESPSFIQGAPPHQIVRLAQGSGFQRKNRKMEKDAMILDIGALQAGDYFGERGLLKKTRRAVSIVTICPVEVLVLNVWDFHRHCDKDIIMALGANEYRKEEYIYKQYKKNCRWEQFKKRCLDDIVDSLNYRRCLRLGPRGMRFIPKADTFNPTAVLPAEWK